MAVDNNRYNQISLIRFISTIMIVICHILQHYNNPFAWWFNVGVQVFFFMSGFLYGQKDIGNVWAWYRKQFTKILKPYYAVILTTILIYGIFHRDCLSIRDIYRSITLTGTLYGMGPLWFVGYICLCYLLTPVLCQIRERLKTFPYTKQLLCIIPFLLLSEIEFLSIHSVFFPVGRWFLFIYGFFFSHFYQQYKALAIKWVLAISSTMCVIINTPIIVVNYNNILNFNMLNNVGGVFQVDSLLWNIGHSMLGVTFFLVMFVSFSNINSNRVLIWSDRYSYHIYLVHAFFIMTPFSLIDLPIPSCVSILLVFLTTAITAVLLRYVERIKLTCINL